MVAYIFKAENIVTKKTYIGKNLSVRFDKKYLGNDSGVLSDVQKYGLDKFVINMIRACETVKDCEMAYTTILKEFNAENDPKFYNYKEKENPSTENRPRRTRKKRTDE